jgi:hypothetical protein
MKSRRKGKRDKRRADRGPGGKFLRGHSIKSPGNPHFNKIAEYRRIIQTAVTPEDLRRVMLRLKRLALDGDMDAIRELLTRMVGKATASPAHAEAVELPELNSPKDTVKAANAIVRAMSDGTLSSDDGAKLAAIVELARRSMETNDLAERIAALETRENHA